MPPKNQPSPFEIVSPAKSKKAGGKGILIAALIIIFLILSVVAGVLLVQQQQQIAQKAAARLCPAAEACPYPQQPSLLRNCHPADADGTPNESLCNTAGRLEICGAAGTQYCCPGPGQAWTTNLTACAVATATPTPTPTATPTPAQTATPVPTATASPVPGACNASCSSDASCASGYVCSGGACRNPLCSSASNCLCATLAPTSVPTATPIAAVSTATPRPIPVTGVDWPTVGGIGVGAAAIILSILIAL